MQLASDKGRNGYGAIDLPADVSMSEYQSSREAQRDSGSSFTATVVNLIKICIGTGILSLPYACARGGLGFSVAVLLFVSLWNDFSVRCLLRAEKVVLLKMAETSRDEHLSLDTVSMLAKIAYFAIGVHGIRIIEAMLIFTVYGVCVAYTIFCADLLGASPFSLDRLLQDTDDDASPSFAGHALNVIACIAITTPPCLQRDVSFLVPYSKAGLIVLACIIAGMFYFGYTQQRVDDVPLDVQTLLPLSFDDFAAVFGVAVFCFGSTPLIFPVKEAMQEVAMPKFRAANLTALLLAALIYIVVGVGLSYAYLGEGRVPSNLLQVLPKAPYFDEERHASLAVATAMRLGYLVVALFTLPLNFVSLANMLEDNRSRHIVGEAGEREMARRMILRLCGLSAVALFAIVVPEFGLVISLLGCFSVTIMSFLLPPCFLMLLEKRWDTLCTAAALGGSLVCIFTTLQTTEDVFHHMIMSSKAHSETEWDDDSALAS